MVAVRKSVRMVRGLTLRVCVCFLCCRGWARYFMKTITKTEAKFFRHILPQYYQHMASKSSLPPLSPVSAALCSFIAHASRLFSRAYAALACHPTIPALSLARLGRAQLRSPLPPSDLACSIDPCTGGSSSVGAPILLSSFPPFRSHGDVLQWLGRGTRGRPGAQARSQPASQPGGQESRRAGGPEGRRAGGQAVVPTQGRRLKRSWRQ